MCTFLPTLCKYCSACRKPRDQCHLAEQQKGDRSIFSVPPRYCTTLCLLPTPIISCSAARATRDPKGCRRIASGNQPASKPPSPTQKPEPSYSPQKPVRQATSTHHVNNHQKQN